MSPLFEVSDIHFGYPERHRVLNGVNFSLNPGERLAITGSNGAGKSTLLRILVGLLKPLSGTVVAFGQRRTKESDFHEVRRRSGYVFQDPDDQLFCPTVAEDIAFGPLNLGKTPTEALTIVDSVLERLHLSDFKNRITHKLSGGEKRLVSLASVLAMEPEVLLLDEPSSALDTDSAERLVSMLNRLPQAMIIVSHDARFRMETTHCTRHLENGVLSAPDAPTQPCHEDT